MSDIFVLYIDIMLIKDINFRHLKLFTEVARLSSVNAASEANYITQSALTQAISKMEKSLQVALFKRRHNGMYLTDAGELLQLRVERCLNFLEQGVREVQKNRERVSNKQRLLHSENMTHVQLKTLIALQHTTSFSSAARNMGVSQPAVYRAARDLENLLNMELFEKTSHGLTLTKSARKLTRYVQLAYRELDLAYAELGELIGRDIVKITVGSMPLARTTLLPAAIDRLSELKPEVSIEIVDGPYDDLLTRLLDGEIDLLIGALRNPVPSTEIEQEALFESPIHVVGRKGHPLTDNLKATKEDLTQYHWVVPRMGTPTRRIFEEQIGQYLENRGGLIECSSQSLINQLLINSDRLTFISSHQLDDEKAYGQLERIPIDIDNAIRPIGITTRKDWHPTTTQQLIISIIRNLSARL